MIHQLLLLYLCLRTSSAGYVSVQLPYANPAGINYVSGQHHYQAGLLAGPARYPVSVASASAPAYSSHAVQVVGTPSYYSYNLPNPVSVPVHPFHAYGGHAAVTPVTYGAVPRPTVVAVAPQPVHPAVSSVTYGAVPRPTVVAVAPQPVHPVVTQYHNVAPVHIPTATAVPVHVPVAAVTPAVHAAVPVHGPVHTTTVTKTVTSEESSVSASTEIPLPVIRSRKYKVRRPAIQNQFYDIEERVIIRPVGSALVELEHPVSKTETNVKTHTVQTDSGSHGHGHAVSTATTTVTQKPQVIPTHTVYHQTPVPQSPALVPHPVVVHASTAGHVVPQAFVPQYQPAIYVNQVQPFYIPTTAVPATYPVTTFKPTHHVTVPVFTTPAPTTVTYPATTEGDVNYDDTVVVEARSGGRTIHVETSSDAPLEYTTAEPPSKLRTKCDEEAVDEPPKRGDIAITYATEATHQSLLSDQENSTDVPSTTTPTTVQPEESEVTSVAEVEINGRIALDERNQSQTAQLQSSSRSADINEVSSSTPRIIITNSGTPEQARTNQEQFIRLLSERDSISEVSYGPNTDTSSSLINTYVRSRVLSATPAPANAKETSRTVNIRRIIVSRPIETEQEVEVHEQSYPTHGYKRQTTASSEQVPVYTTAKPPAFANDADEVK